MLYQAKIHLWMLSDRISLAPHNHSQQQQRCRMSPTTTLYIFATSIIPRGKSIKVSLTLTLSIKMPTVVTNESSLLQTTVSVAPLVLLSVVDHYERVVQAPNAPTNSNDKRVVGVILGDNTNKNLIKVTNSFAIPFEEDEKNRDIWFLDHDFIESMMEMFKKINAKERLIGWYHSGPKLKSSDLQINELFKRFTPNPLLLIVDVNSTDIVDIPTDSYLAIEEIRDDGSSAEKTFIHLPSIIQAEEAEEIGVEHLLRDIRDQACGNLSIRLTNNFKSLKSLNDRIANIVQYLRKILSGELPINNVILGKLQDIFNLLPNLVAVQGDPTKPATASANQLATSFNVKTNDELMMVYISSLVRSILAFHDLIDNKIENKKNNEKDKEFTPTEEEPQQAAIESK